MKSSKTSPMQMIRFDELERKIGIRRTKIYSEIKSGNLPKPVKFGQKSLWVESEVDDALRKLADRRS